jgi:hypothetical protein
MDCSSSLAVSSTSSEQTHHLSDCPIIRNHLSRPIRNASRAGFGRGRKPIAKRSLRPSTNMMRIIPRRREETMLAMVPAKAAKISNAGSNFVSDPRSL